MDILDTSGVTELASKLNLVSYLVNIFNGVLSLLIFVIWCFTTKGKRSAWQIVSVLALCQAIDIEQKIEMDCELTRPNSRIFLNHSR